MELEAADVFSAERDDPLRFPLGPIQLLMRLPIGLPAPAWADGEGCGTPPEELKRELRELDLAKSVEMSPFDRVRDETLRSSVENDETIRAKSSFSSCPRSSSPSSVMTVKW